MTAKEVYDHIISTTPKDSRDFIKHTAALWFEKRVWYLCEPDKALANEVMKIADARMEES